MSIMRTIVLVVSCVAVFCAGCSRFRNAPTESKDARYVVISPIYNEIIWALGTQDRVVGVDLSTTYPRSQADFHQERGLRCPFHFQLRKQKARTTQSRTYRSQRNTSQQNKSHSVRNRLLVLVEGYSGACFNLQLVPHIRHHSVRLILLSRINGDAPRA
jgi:hypothetical protein